MILCVCNKKHLFLDQCVFPALTLHTASGNPDRQFLDWIAFVRAKIFLQFHVGFFSISNLKISLLLIEFVRARIACPLILVHSLPAQNVLSYSHVQSVFWSQTHACIELRPGVFSRRADVCPSYKRLFCPSYKRLFCLLQSLYGRLEI